MTAWSNYSSTSDFLRFWILHEIGGIYMDCDTYSSGSPLPVSIVAPRGLLLLIEKYHGKTQVSACIAASTQGNPKLADLVRHMEKKYHEGELPKEEDGIRSVTQESRERYEKCEYWRKKSRGQNLNTLCRT